MAPSIKQVISFEIADDDHQNYHRYTFRVNLIKLCLFALVIAFVSISLTICFDRILQHNESENTTSNETPVPLNQNGYHHANSESLQIDQMFPKRRRATNADSEKADFIKRMFVEAWTAYKKHAWGSNNLQPLSRSGEFGEHSGLSLVKSMSTLWAMDLMDEFNESAKWIESKFDFANSPGHAYTFVAATEYLGSLLSCYALSKRKLFLDEARKVGKSLEPAFNTKTGFPSKSIYPKIGIIASDTAHLAEVGGIQLEFKYLSYLTGSKTLDAKLDRVREQLLKINKPQGLYLSDVRTDVEGEWASEVSTLFWPANTFYQNLMKWAIQGHDDFRMYNEAIDAVEKAELIVTYQNVTYARTYHPEAKTYGNTMNHEGCALGGMLALGAHEMEMYLMRFYWTPDIERRKLRQVNLNEYTQDLNRIQRHWKLAEELTETCHTVSNRTQTGLPPETFFFDQNGMRFIHGSTKFGLMGDLAESYFYMWRLTHQQKYRTYAWELAQAIYNHARVDQGRGGYAEVLNVDHKITTNAEPSHGRFETYDDEDFDYDFHHRAKRSDNHRDHQTSHFMSSTLKYLYLTFSDDEVLPLDKWVFNRVGQPLPIQGKNEAYD